MDAEEWVEEKLEEGEPVEEVRKELSGAGWSDEDIDRIIRRARSGRGRRKNAGERQTGSGDTGSGKNYLRPIALFTASALIGFLIVTAVSTLT